MRRHLSLFLALVTLALTSAPTTRAHDAAPGIVRQLLTSEVLPNVPGHSLTALKLVLPPGAIAAPHRHEAFVFVYLLEGQVRSQLNEEPPMDYVTGESWVEAPNALHTLTQNLSETKAATLLVVFVAQEGATLTTSGAIDQ